MGRVVSPGRTPRQFAAAPNVATGKHDVVVRRCGLKGGCLAKTSLLSATETAGGRASCSARHGSP